MTVVAILFTFLQIPALIATLVFSVWASMKLSRGEDLTARWMTAVAFIASCVVTVGDVGELITLVRYGSFGGQFLLSLFFGAFWGYFMTYSLYRRLQAFG